VDQHNRDTMFHSLWSWLAPVVGAVAVFCFVMLTTPPGFRAIGDGLLGTLRGPSADAAAYALAAAASLALVALIVLALVAGVLELLLERRE
jgi:hypothetical protein